MTVRIADNPQLRLLVENRPGCEQLDDGAALLLYEQNWWRVDEGALTDAERAVIDRLIQEVGQGVFLV